MAPDGRVCMCCAWLCIKFAVAVLCMCGGAACSEIGPYSDHDYGGYEDAMLAREVRAN